jgi:FtsZ-interacting cell division protein YlmF
MKALIEWIKNFLGLVKVEEVKPAPVVEEKLTPPQPPKAEPKPKAAPKPKAEPKAKAAPKAEPKVTKASLNKLTKAQLEEEGRKVGLELDKRKKKADLVDEVFKQLK